MADLRLSRTVGGFPRTPLWVAGWLAKHLRVNRQGQAYEEPPELDEELRADYQQYLAWWEQPGRVTQYVSETGCIKLTLPSFWNSAPSPRSEASASQMQTPAPTQPNLAGFNPAWLQQFGAFMALAGQNAAMVNTGLPADNREESEEEAESQEDEFGDATTDQAYEHAWDLRRRFPLMPKTQILEAAETDNPVNYALALMQKELTSESVAEAKAASPPSEQPVGMVTEGPQAPVLLRMRDPITGHDSPLTNLNPEIQDFWRSAGIQEDPNLIFPTGLLDWLDGIRKKGKTWAIRGSQNSASSKAGSNKRKTTYDFEFDNDIFKRFRLCKSQNYRILPSLLNASLAKIVSHRTAMKEEHIRFDLLSLANLELRLARYIPVLWEKTKATSTSRATVELDAANLLKDIAECLTVCSSMRARAEQRRVDSVIQAIPLHQRPLTTQPAASADTLPGENLLDDEWDKAAAKTHHSQRGHLRQFSGRKRFKQRSRGGRQPGGAGHQFHANTGLMKAITASLKQADSSFAGPSTSAGYGNRGRGRGGATRTRGRGRGGGAM